MGHRKTFSTESSHNNIQSKDNNVYITIKTDIIEKPGPYDDHINVMNWDMKVGANETKESCVTML